MKLIVLITTAKLALLGQIAPYLVRADDFPPDGLHEGSPESVGMDSAVFKEMERNLSAYTVAANYSAFSKYKIHPIEPGGSVSVGHKNTIVSHLAFGKKETDLCKPIA